jgi:hypothetical protein
MQGLGKGGAKRHRKILRDNIQGQFNFQFLRLPSLTFPIVTTCDVADTV